MPGFELVSPYAPAGGQPQAIEQLVRGAKLGLEEQTMLGVTGAFMSLEFVILHAPDVAISEAAVGAVLGTVLFLIAIRKTTKKEDEEE